MKFSKAKELYAAKKLLGADVFRNPSNRDEWFVMLHNDSGKSFILADDDDVPIAAKDLGKFLLLLKSIGFGQACVHF